MSGQKELFNQEAFFDGQSIDAKIGTKASFASSCGFDWRQEPSELVQAKQPRRIDSGNLTSLIVNIVAVSTGERFALCENGSVWIISTTNTVTEFGNIGESGAFGMAYRSDTDTLYIAGLSKLHVVTPVSDVANRQLVRDFLAASESTNTSGSYPSTRTGGLATYSLPTSLQEGDKLHFTSDIEPLRSFKLDVAAKGSGDWTVEIHDPLDRVLATKTIAAADMTNGWTDFEFSTPAELLVKPNARVYHAHIYSSASGAALFCGTPGNLDTANFHLTADRFVPSAGGIHAIEHFLEFLAIQHGRYTAIWEPLTENPSNTEYARHMVTAPDNWDGVGLTQTDEYLIMGYKKVAADLSRDFQEGLLIFWNGRSKLAGTASYQFPIRFRGTIQALYTENNVPHFIIGQTLYAWLGGRQLTKIRRLTKARNDFTGVKDDTRVYPYMMTTHDEILQVGFPSSTSNESVEFGIYNYGAAGPEYTPSFGYQYVPSHGERITNDDSPLKLGCIAAFGDEMYLSWQKGDQYGLDIIDAACKPAASFRAVMLSRAAGNLHKTKTGHRLVIGTNQVPEGTTAYALFVGDDGEELLSDEPLATGETNHSFAFDKDFHVVAFGLVGTSDETAELPLRVKAIGLEWDPNPDAGVVD